MRTAILDRDKQNIRYLHGFIRDNYEHWTVYTYTTSFALAAAVYEEFRGEIELLIVYAGEESNVELVKDLQECFPHIRVIFYSGTTDCAIPTFFLVLPFREEIVAAAFERVQTGCEEDLGGTFVLQFRGQRQKLRFSAIRYLESCGRKMLLYTDKGFFETYMTVEAALEKLPPQFMQCHRSYIVNTDKIEKCGRDGILLLGKVMIPISRPYQKKIRVILEGKGEERCW